MKMENRLEAVALTYRAMELQLTEDGELKEVEDLLLQAVDTDSHCIEALQETAHFYDAVIPQADSAKRYASSCKILCLKIIDEMDAILNDE